MESKSSDLFIVDNSVSGWTGLKYLEQWTEISSGFDIATGYFEIGSLLALDGHWQKLEKIRVLMGDEITIRTKKAILEALTRRSKDAVNSNLEFEKEDDPFLKGVPAIIKAIETGQIECRVYVEGKFHAKTFITHPKLDVIGSKALVGSSNFTKPGLTDNIELNVQIQSSSEVTQLQSWYEEYWEAAEDISEDILKVIEPHAKEWRPFDIYAHSLNELFKDREVSSSYWEENDSIIFPMLDQYQKEAYWSLSKISNRFGGAFLCDGVGLGKTFVGLMLLEKMIRKDKKHVVLFAPKGAKEGVWNPLIKDLLPDLSTQYFSNLAVFSHTDLHRESLKDDFEKVSEIADIIIIDEAHHFRNKGTIGDSETGEKRSRYYKFRDFIQNGNENKKVFMLTATPINNKLTDIRNLIELFTNQNESYFSKTLGIHNLRGHFTKLEKDLKNTHGNSVENVSGNVDIIDSFLKSDEIFENLIVQRSRRYVLESQKQEVGAAAIFPEREKPQVANYNLFTSYSSLLDMIEIAFSRSSPLFSLAVYNPYDYYIGDPSELDEMDLGRKGNIVSLIRTSFLKRFESSVSAFETSCDRMVKKLLAFQEKHCETKDEIEHYQSWKEKNSDILNYSSTKQLQLWGEEDEDDPELFPEELLENWEYLERDKYNVEDIIKETFKDLDELVKFLAETRKFEPKNDDKLKKLIRLLKSKKFDQKKVIIFTEFADTARYIESQISKKDHNIEGVARIDGGSSGSRYDAVRQFAPYYNHTSSLDLKAENINEIRVLVATDVLSEGLNLQDCTLLVNYDIHWNPVRLLQRIGRVDRRINKEIEEKIIANHPEYSADRGKVSFYNFLPPNELERLVGIYNTVNKKALLISKTMGIEGQKLLTPEDEYQALKEFNVGYEGKTSLLENLHLDLQNLLKNIPELKDQLNNMPGAIFSGRALPKKGTKGVFFCFRLPGWDEDNADFLNGAGPCRWYLYDVSKKVILEEIADIIDSVKCKQETPRKISSKPETLKEIRDNIKKHIKNSYLKKIEAPLNDKNNNEISPKLIAWMEIS